MLMMSGMAYILPRCYSRVCDYLINNQNFGQEGNVPRLISCVARHVVNRCVVMRRYFNNAWIDRPFAGLCFASAYDSAWIVIPLFAKVFSTVPLCLSLSSAFLFSLLFELARKCMELVLVEFQVTLHASLRTSLLMPKHVVLKYLACTVRLLFYICTPLYLSFVFHEFKYTTIEYLFLMLLISATAIGLLWTHLELCIEKIRTSNNSKYLFDQVVLNPGETLPECPIIASLPRRPVMLRKCGHIFDEDALLAQIASQGRNATCALCRRPIEALV